MEITDHMLHISDLRNLLHDVLLITEDVKEILQKNCEEAAFVLKPWQMETAFKKRKDQSICNCKKEKMELNVPQKRSLKRSPIKTIYSSGFTSVNDHKRVLQKDATVHKVNIAKSLDNKNSTELKSGKVISDAMRKSVLPDPINDVKQSYITDKTESKTFTKIATKPKRDRNFILENKLSVTKAILSSKSTRVHDSNNTSSTLRKSVPFVSAAELSNLACKMAQQSIDNTVISSNNDIRCPLHKNNILQVQDRMTMMNITEALQHANIPNEIVRVLRMYYRFLKTETHKLENKDKNRKSVDIFLQEFEATNTFIQDNLLQERQWINIATESISLLDIVFNRNLNSAQFNGIKNVMAESEVALEQYIKNIREPIIKSSSNPPDLFSEKGWVSNGIWNISCMKYFKDFSKVYNVKYNDKKQLLSLYETMQKLQRSGYLNILIQIILHDIIPATKSIIDPMNASYARAYKTIFVLAQGLNPEMPVLVRTDN